MSFDQTQFCDDWLQSWSGNQPEKLIEFYHPEAIYKDPGLENFLKGKSQLLNYFQKLLSQNSNWTWLRDELFPTKNGFTLKWKATIPVKNQIITEYGLDIVELNNHLIIRNEVYFDRTQLLNILFNKNK